MASARAFPRLSCPAPGSGRGIAPVVPDEDDGIHVASVTRIERPSGPAIQVVVSWFEEGTWIERSVELAEIAGAAPWSMGDSDPGFRSS